MLESSFPFFILLTLVTLCGLVTFCSSVWLLRTNQQKHPAPASLSSFFPISSSLSICSKKKKLFFLSRKKPLGSFASCHCWWKMLPNEKHLHAMNKFARNYYRDPLLLASPYIFLLCFFYSTIIINRGRWERSLWR